MALTDARQLKPILSLYKEYSGVSGLNINFAKAKLKRYLSAPLSHYVTSLRKWERQIWKLLNTWVCTKAKRLTLQWKQ
jgi:hypothetical protein